MRKTTNGLVPKVSCSTRSGFTIVELLIVIVVIAILATISIVAYNGIQQRARASEASTALTQAKKKLELYRVDNSTYPTTSNLAAAGITNGDVSYQYTSNNTGASFCLTATVGSTSYNITNISSSVEGACIGHSNGGGTFATNLMSSPSFEGAAPGWYSNWSNYVGGVISQASGDGVVVGDSAMELAVTTSNQSGARYTINGLSPNTMYTFSLYITPISGDVANLGINIGDAAGTRANNAFGSSLVVGQTVRKTVTWTSSSAPGTTQFALFRFAAGTSAATFRVDAAMLEQGSTATAYNG